MKRLILSIGLALALTGCGTLTAGSVASAGANVADTVHVPPPAAVADKTVLDEQGMLAVELAYKAARTAVEAGVDAGWIKGANASRAAQLDNQAFLAVATVRQVYATGNAGSYRAALTSASAVIAQIVTLAHKPGA